MKTMITITAMLMLGIMAQAQVEFGVTGGLASANLHEERFMPDSSIKMLTGNPKAGFTGGIMANLKISRHLYVYSGLNFVQKHLNWNETEDGIKTTACVKLNYLEVPINLVFKTDNRNDLDVLFGFGPTISYGLSGKSRIKDLEAENNPYKIKFGDNVLESDLQRLDVGGNVLMGIESPRGFLFSANYNFGLSNLNPGDNKSEDLKFKSSYWGVKIGYILNKKKR